MLLAHITQIPFDLATRAPEVPPALARLVMTMLAKDPAARPADADAVIAALEAMPGGTRGTAPSPAVDGATAPTAAALTPATVAPAEPPPRRRRGGLVV